MHIYAKAIAAFITPLIITPLAVLGIGAETPFASAVEIIFISLITAAMVYLVPNRQ